MASGGSWITPLKRLPPKLRGIHQDESPAFVLDYEEDEEFIGLAEDEVEVEVTADSGCVDHTCNEDDIPKSIKPEVPKDRPLRHFVNASGGRIKNHGKVVVDLQHENGDHTRNSFNVADVVRPLHSVSKICDTEKEMLFTDTEAYVVPKGTFSDLIASVRVFAKYPRKGGLYTAKVRVKDPNRKPAAGFGGRGIKS